MRPMERIRQSGADSRTTDSRTTDTRTADGRPGEGIRLLIIDDEPSHAEAVAESLGRVGYECLVATSGSEGARRIEQDEPNVVLTDLKMDGVDGLAIVKKARAELPDAEVVVITGYGDVQSAV